MFHVKHEGLIREAATLGVTLDVEQAARLDRYEALLRERAAGLGMIARGDLGRLRERHILDSLRAVPAVPEDAGETVDLGSGAGLPGIPVAIARPEVHVILAESRRQRIAFLELAAAELGLANVSVHPGRAETAPSPAGVCLARAFRDARGSWEVAQMLLGPGGRLVYFAGSAFDPARDLPATAAATVLPTSPLANAGPLVIMTRQ
jgi:16S rRNA (guanine527-N7)-methyltransferase